ncbi:MAG: ExbD/TolR family protein [Candidatus Polarisedimenticolia bacterium]
MAMQLGGSGVKSDINVTPFVDIVLVLLIIFMVVTPLLSRALDISVPPKTEAEAPTDVVEQLIITVRGPVESPVILLNQEEIPGGAGAVRERIEGLMKGRREKVVFFQAENEIPYQFVVGVMDEIRGGGAEKIGLITDEALGLNPAGTSGQ